MGHREDVVADSHVLRRILRKGKNYVNVTVFWFPAKDRVVLNQEVASAPKQDELLPVVTDVVVYVDIPGVASLGSLGYFKEALVPH